MLEAMRMGWDFHRDDGQNGDSKHTGAFKLFDLEKWKHLRTAHGMHWLHLFLSCE